MGKVNPFEGMSDEEFENWLEANSHSSIHIPQPIVHAYIKETDPEKREQMLDDYKRIQPDKWEQAMLKGDLTVEMVIDRVIKLNGIIGVGLITLGDRLRDYVHDKLRKNDTEKSG